MQDSKRNAERQIKIERVLGVDVGLAMTDCLIFWLLVLYTRGNNDNTADSVPPGTT